MTCNVAFIGLGVMGYPMAGYISKAGHNVTVFNRTKSKAEKWIAEYKGKMANTPAEAADGADFIFTCVGNDDDLREVATGENGLFNTAKAGSIFIDNKAKRKLTIDDILIVTPYNVQVNYLLENLKKGSRVGTVDKFQGQEAPVTIVSMVSSDTDSLPRNKSWFFNRNRLNVALSRSQCSSIILFNPDLLKTAPSDLEEIKLLNNFHKLLKFRVN